VPQGRNLFGQLSVFENLELGGITLGMKTTHERIPEVLEFFPRVKRAPALAASSLSGGEQKQLEIGRALLLRPKVLLIDEPSIGLSPLVVQDVFRLLRKLAEQGTTVLMVEQNVKSALKISDDAIALESGRLVLHKPASELLVTQTRTSTATACSSVTGARSVCAAPFDGGRLGADLKRLRPPAPLLSFLGMSIGGDLRHFLRAGRAWDSFLYAAKRTSCHLLELALHGQGRLRLGGNALAAALLKSVLDAGVSLRERHAAVGLIEEGEGRGSRIVGAQLRTPQGEVTLRARAAVWSVPAAAFRTMMRARPPSSRTRPTATSTAPPPCPATPATACAWPRRPAPASPPTWQMRAPGARCRWYRTRRARRMDWAPSPISPTWPSAASRA
jgi:hypothetical protein